MKSKEEIEQLADSRYLQKAEAINDSEIRGYIVSATKGGFVDGYTQCQEDVQKEPFNNFYLRLKNFVSNVQVNDQMSEEEKEMIIHVCNKQLNKQD